jgi:hypothetical protein
MASLSFQTLDPPKKLCRECRFAPKAFIARVGSKAHLHVTGSRFEGSSKDAQLLLFHFEQQCSLCHERPHACEKPDE